MTNATAAERARLTRSAALASIAMAVVLVAAKLWAVWTSGSTAMLGSLADTALDLIASIATLVGVLIAAQPADRDHRFGHGKAEALAAMFQVVLIAISAIGLIARAGQQWLAGARVAGAEEGIPYPFACRRPHRRRPDGVGQQPVDRGRGRLQVGGIVDQ